MKAVFDSYTKLRLFCLRNSVIFNQEYLFFYQKNTKSGTFLKNCNK